MAIKEKMPGKENEQGCWGKKQQQNKPVSRAPKTEMHIKVL